MSKSPKKPEPTQAEKFKAAARKVGTDNDPAAFDAKVRKLAKPAKTKTRS
jgi:hypothetical protein